MTEQGAARFCPSCGAPAAPEHRFCRTCGTPLHGEDVGFDDRFPFAQGAAAPAAARPRYGGFWIRVGAYLIDALVLSIPAYVLDRAGGEAGGLALLALAWVYYAGLESSPRQATVGKMACGLVVTDDAGRRIGFGRATGRYFAKILSALIFCIGFLMVGWTERKQGLHDFVAGTLVLRGSRS